MATSACLLLYPMLVTLCYVGLTIIFDIKVINKFKATNAGHKDMLAVLAAVTEVRYTIPNI